MNSQQKRYIGQGVWKGASILSVNTCICTPTWKLSKLCTLGNFVEPSSCRFDQSLTQSSGSLLSLEEVGWGKDTSKVLIMAWLFWETDLHPETIQESNNNHPQQNKRHSCHPGNSKRLGLQGKKTNKQTNKNTSVQIKDAPCVIIIQEITMILRVLCQEMEAEGKIHIFSIIS